MTSPGTVVIVGHTDDWAKVTPDGAQIIITLSALAVAVPPPGRLLAVYSGNEGELDAALAKAISLKTRVFAVHDGPDFYPSSALKKLRAWDLPASEAYRNARNPSETLSQAVSRWAQMFAVLNGSWAFNWGCVTQLYTMNGAYTEADVVAALTPAVELINAYSRVKISPYFAWTRDDGCTGSALFRTMASELAQASPGIPALIPVPVPPVPSTVNWPYFFRRSA